MAEFPYSLPPLVSVTGPRGTRQPTAGAANMQCAAA